MNLFEAAAYRLFGNRYRIRSFVVFLVWEREQAELAEKVFTILNNATIEHGTGFSTCDPGHSVESAYEIERARWEEYASYAIEESPLATNDAAELALFREFDAKKAAREEAKKARILQGAMAVRDAYLSRWRREEAELERLVEFMDDVLAIANAEE